MQLLNPTYRYQSKLAAFCRDRGPAPEQVVHPEHVKHYRRLVFNVVQESLTAAFPLTVDLLTAEEWESLVHEFFREHNCSSPQIWKMPGELVDFLAAKEHLLKIKYPHLLELLLFEWMEVEVYMMPDAEYSYSSTGDPEKDELVLNPEHHLLQLEFPVHLKNARHIHPVDKGNYYALLFRQAGTYKVQFMNINMAHVRLLALLSDKPQSAEELVQNLSTTDSTKEQQDTLREGILKFIAVAHEKGLIPGFKK